ncbi:MAG: hypothetical protein AABY26_04585 [Nanoarchaeota archaeon]
MSNFFAKLVPLTVLEHFEHFLLNNPSRAAKFLNHANPHLLEEFSGKKALHIFQQAAKESSGYHSFLQQYQISTKNIHTLEDFNRLVPATDKANYIKQFSFEQRCRQGHLPKTGNIDESGGTSGKATNWIHDFKEEDLLFKAVNFEYNYIFDSGKNKDYLVISAWSTGPWATGIKFCELMERIALVKNTATDPRDIIDTLKMFGTEKHYLIGGYPPFLKNLIDDCSDQINWKDYKIDLITGGEGVPIEWVYYMQKKLLPGAKIVSSYGASDIDIGVGFETPFCFFLRELAFENEKLRKELFGRDELPMLFQYNPLVHYIHNITNEQGQPEFEITLLDRNAALPKVKYALHDEGKKFGYVEMTDLIFKHCPLFLDEFEKRGGKLSEVLHLPFLTIFGRSDGTLSFDGANVFPNQIEGGILRDKRLSKLINRFKMEKRYDKKHTVEFHVHLELKKGVKSSETLKKKAEKSILEELLQVDPDYRESYQHNRKLFPRVSLYKFEHPLFKQDDAKCKNIYMMKNKMATGKEK